ncbi:MAG TPA: type II secretion system F family protein [Candidatus Polarisedimenticolia bacterium]|jgi:tight adherence protein B|nr:type II secretion system F family protein [Candidatus Polarisedimenticolia bacterium]
MLVAVFLVFCSTSLMVVGVGMFFVRQPSRSVDKLMMARMSAVLAASGAGDEELSILKDSTLSGIGPLQRVLLRFRAGGKLKRLLEQADLKMKTGTLVLLIACAGVAGFLLPLGFHQGILIALAAAVLGGFLPVLVVMRIRTKRFRRFEAQFPDAIDLLSRAIRAGHAFNTGIKMIADEMPDPVAKEFQKVFEEQNYGLPLKTALLNLLERIALLDLKLFVVAVLIQRQSGGNLAELLGKISQTIRERFRIFRQLKVHTAQAKLTGIILMCLPPVMGAITLALNYEYMKIIFQDPWGIRLLIAAAVLQLMGLIWIRKIVNIEV